MTGSSLMTRWLLMGLSTNWSKIGQLLTRRPPGVGHQQDGDWIVKDSIPDNWTTAKLT